MKNALFIHSFISSHLAEVMIEIVVRQYVYNPWAQRWKHHKRSEIKFPPWSQLYDEPSSRSRSLSPQDHHRDCFSSLLPIFFALLRKRSHFFLNFLSLYFQQCFDGSLWQNACSTCQEHYLKKVAWSFLASFDGSSSTFPPIRFPTPAFLWDLFKFVLP